MAEILYGKPVAQKIEEEILILRGKFAPCLGIIEVENDPSHTSYANSIEKLASKFEIKVERKKLTLGSTETDFINAIDEFNKNPEIHGIILMKPLPPSVNDLKISEKILPEKDIDSVNPYNFGRLAMGNPLFSPCTPLGVLYLLDFYGINLQGKNVTIVGRSNVVGKPLALLLIKKGIDATVTICHTKTKNLKTLTQAADIIIVATGRPNLLTKEFVREKSIVIDVGTNFVDGKLKGDADFENLKDYVKAITPVPGGVGVITTRILLLNLFKSCNKK